MDESMWALLTFVAILIGPMFFIGILVAAYFIGKVKGKKDINRESTFYIWKNIHISKIEMIVLTLIIIASFFGPILVGILITIFYLIGKSRGIKVSKS